MAIIVKNTKGSFPEMVSKFWDAERSLISDFFDFDAPFKNWMREMEVPSANVIEHEKEYAIEISAPGKQKEDFKVEVEGEYLHVSSEKKEETEENKPNFRRREFSYNYLSRSFRIPENTLPHEVTAKYENGILHLSLPKKAVEVKSSKKAIEVA
jgi:HSP20 family protein